MTPYCGCEGWEQENADGPYCGGCGHHYTDHYADEAGCGYDPEEDL